ncbi:MAG TPA: regulatory iron-sulfur-containing complex subunit RicT [Spirochaetia bacterium]|nr:regulatory iron-sulfur-containing complex subunit RicT [Spirochaetia bacterium]
MTDTMATEPTEESGVEIAENSAPDVLWLVKVLHSSETELCRLQDGVEVATDDLVIIPTKYGKDFGRVLGTVNPESASTWDTIRQIQRVATEADHLRYEENSRRADEALGICRDKVRQHELDMTLVSAHFMLEEPKILFFFTADGRVDFRDLVKDLVSVFRMRVELRQIGVRDESRVLGGLGVCGRVLCCHGLTDKLKPVSIKMAKVQNLSLNSIKISGPCGRLLCCLAYEHEFYRDTRKSLPAEGHRLSYDGTVFRITEVNILSRQIRLLGDDGRYLVLPTCRFSYDAGTQRWKVLDELPCETPA